LGATTEICCASNAAVAATKKMAENNVFFMFFDEFVFFAYLWGIGFPWFFCTFYF
jgi:hypothetical protein